ncbi:MULTISPECIES: LPS translocon maturation chaperone LptM [Hyphomonas]|jgi:hypothetical protein|uniref:Lipoprotein n=2 Tax=Hyphomonas adhaerens TaxID=81029 RepID=A0A069E4Z4_9PROT|nr:MULTISPECIES: hypothetical protein [Hyphomonas]KCZ85122.1 hypothetical protein HAD_05555 [Hyphomonas adhaerens MHS-3]MBB39546.1 hypothetical protein [Hyphomonas sp.]HAE27011.1 hypothetical protein [Hyphomonas adhaerens]|tara:strand:- start:234 stop:467 length:234 start_codon:yes stop_codon:yes gene_type:complete
MKRPLAIAALILGTLALPACGLTGDLKRPDPLWGDPNDVEAELPEGNTSTLPKLPPRQEAEDSDTSGEDELLGGPED